MLCTEIVSDIQQFVHNMFSPCSAKRRASDKDLPVPTKNKNILKIQLTRMLLKIISTGTPLIKRFLLG